MPDARWLDREAVAAHLSLKEHDVARLVRAGRLPAPSYHLGPKSPRWDRAALDALFGAAVASSAPEVTLADKVTALAARIARGEGSRRPRRQANLGGRHGQGIPLPQAR